MANSTTCLIQAIGSIPTILIASLGLLFLWTSNGIPTSFQQFKAEALIHLMLELFWVFSKKSSRLRTNQSHINIYCATSTFDSIKYDWTCPLLVVHRSKIYPINQSRNPLQALYKAKFIDMIYVRKVVRMPSFKSLVHLLKW